MLDGKMGTTTPQYKPPNKNRIPAKYEYLQQMEIDSAYVPPRTPSETTRLYKRCIYNTLITYLQAEANEKGM
jgi:hypothetical protein